MNTATLNKINEQVIYISAPINHYSNSLAYINKRGKVYRIIDNEWYILLYKNNNVYWYYINNSKYLKKNNYRCYPLNNISYINNVLYLEDSYTGTILGKMNIYNNKKKWNWKKLKNKVNKKTLNVITNIPISNHDIEYRKDPYDNEYYTKKEFIEYYNGTIEWDIMEPKLILKRELINNYIFKIDDIYVKNYLLDKLIDTFMY